MNFFWGKAVFDFFLGCMIISAYVVPAIDVPATIFFIATTIVLAITIANIFQFIQLTIFRSNQITSEYNSVFFRKEERERIDKDLERIKQLDEIKAKKLQAKQLAQLAAQNVAQNAQNSNQGQV